jgi:hypothetical protein
VTTWIGFVSRFETSRIASETSASRISPTSSSVVRSECTGARTSLTGTEVRKLQPAASTFDQVSTTSLPVNGSFVSTWPLRPAAIDSATALSSALCLESASLARLALPFCDFCGLASSTPFLETANA